jgi:hypothetical protein
MRAHPDVLTLTLQLESPSSNDVPVLTKLEPRSKVTVSSDACRKSQCAAYTT